jgi:transposase-like protein
MSKQRNHLTPEQKAKIVLEALREDNTVNEITAKHNIHPAMVNRWKQEFLERAPEVFKKTPRNPKRISNKSDPM